MQQHEQIQDDDVLRHEWNFTEFDEDDMDITVSLVCNHCNGELRITRDFDNSRPCSGRWPADGAVWELEIHELEEN